VYRYTKDLLARSPKVATYIAGGADAVKKLKSGDGSQRPALSFMERVEMDSHKIDGRFCVSVPAPNGDHRPRIVHRIWVTVILEVLSRAVLGYHLSFGREVTKDDVLRAIKSALTPWKPRQVSFSDKAYVAGAGLPSALGSEFTGLCWDETSVDGALAETCETIRTVLKDAVGSTLRSPDEGYSARRSKDDRPYIESFFRTLGERGFQKMSNTTGGNAGDTKGRTPELVAVNSMFQIEYAEELLDVLICNYNATPHSAHSGGRSPLAQFRFLAERYPERVRVCPEQAITEHFSTRKLCKVRGGGSTGKLPYVEFVHARYTNELLHGRFDLVGKQIWVINHLDNDARVAMASTQDGRSLGILRAAPPWHQTPHSLTVRQGIKKLHDRHQFLLLNGADGVETFLDFVESQPDSQLPVYPAYLEARRILSEATKSIETASIRNAALNKVSQPRPATTESSKDSADESKLANAAVEQTLPPMRKAISR
jgi:transposase InsO family protein